MLFFQSLSVFIHENLIFAVALAIIPLKLVMVKLCGDRESEMETALAIPEDLSYVSMGLILGTLTVPNNPIPAVLKGSPYPRTEIGVILMFNFGLSIIIHKISQHWTRRQYQTWRAAGVIRSEITPPVGSQLNLALQAVADQPPDANVFHIFFGSLTKMLFSILLQIGLIWSWLSWIASLYSTK